MRIAALFYVVLAGCVPPHPVEVVHLEQPTMPGPWIVLHQTLDGCARAQGIVGGFSVHISVDEDGRPGNVWSDPGNGYTDCIGGQIARTKFPKHFQNRTIEIPFFAQQ